MPSLAMRVLAMRMRARSMHAPATRMRARRMGGEVHRGHSHHLAPVKSSLDPQCPQANPSILRNLGGEVDIEAEPTYGEITTAG